MNRSSGTSPTFAVLLLLILPGWLSAQPEGTGVDRQRLARVDSFLQDAVDRGIVPNAQAYVYRRGEVILRATYGLADLESGRPARPDDIYRIASQTKALVSVGLMKLYERGKFLLEDPIAKYIPAFARTQVLGEYDTLTGRYPTVPPDRPITIRHLLSHTSGIPYGMPADWEGTDGIPIHATFGAISTEEVANRIAARPLVSQPGEAFVYGLSTDVIGRLVEVLSGMPLDEYMQREVFGPLGMTDSYFYLPEEKHDRLVTLYSKPGPDAPLEVHENEVYRDWPLRGARTFHSAGAGSVGTIDDYARFCRMLLNGGELEGVRLLNPRTVAMMTRNQIGAATVWDRNDKFGLGFQLIGPDSRYGDLASEGAFTWGGLFCSEYTIDPAEELVMLVYYNVHPVPQYGDLVRKFRILVYQALE
jgi:CubicO group peptidase (beta-lactamase class C family)